MMLRLLLAVLFWLGVADIVHAQQCNNSYLLNSVGALPLTQIAPAVTGQRVGVCGYVFTVTGAGAAPQLSYGTGTNCGTGTAAVTPVFNLPNGGILVDHQSVVAAFAPPGAALCIQVTGTGTVTGAIYWTQF